LSFGVGFACTTNVNPSAREYFFESLHAEFIAEGESSQGNGTRHPTSAAMPFCGYINQYISDIQFTSFDGTAFELLQQKVTIGLQLKCTLPLMAQELVSASVTRHSVKKLVFSMWHFS